VWTGLPNLNTLEMITCDYFKRDTHLACMEFLAKCSDVSYTPVEAGYAFGCILAKCEVDSRRLEQIRAVVLARKEV
jgi:hypothetical protein